MKPIGYVLRKFPVLSETFILNEILALEDQGVPVRIFSLARPSDPHFHENLCRLRAPITYIPDVTNLTALLRYNRRAAEIYRHRYYRVLLKTVTRGRPELLWRFLQAGYLAVQARRRRVAQFHAHFATRPTSVALLASDISGIPYSFTAHAYDIFKDTIDKGVLKTKIRRAKFVIAISDYNKNYLASIDPDSNGKVMRFYNGIDLARFVPPGSPPTAPFVVLCVARLVEKKGLPVLIDACATLRDRGIDFRCWIAGKGALRPQLEAQIARLHLDHQVQLLGSLPQREVLARYQAAHLFVLPCVVGQNGNRDGLPVSIVEALACGLPVISTPVTGVPEVVKPGKNGLLVPERDALALANAMQTVICDRALHGRLSAAARSSVAAQFDLLHNATALKRLLRAGPP